MSDVSNSGTGRPPYVKWVVLLSVVINLAVMVLYGMPGRDLDSLWGIDLKVLPLLNAIYNTFTFLFLVAAYRAIRRKDVDRHRRFIVAAFVTTSLFLVTYVAHHYLSAPTPYGGEGLLRGLYYFILITHIVLAAVIVPLALYSLFSGLHRHVDRHRRIARWTMPLWLYVAITGVLVYVMISPYY